MAAAVPLERRRLRGAEQVRDAAGRWRTVRTWNLRDEDDSRWHRFTAYGRQVGHPSVRYIVEVPVTAHFKRTDGRVDTYTHQQDGTRWTIPVDEDAIGRLKLPADLRVARDVGDHNRQKRFIRDALVRYLRAQPRDKEGNILLQAFDQSDCWFTLDEDALTDLDGFFVSTETEVFHADAAPYVETILNRPLRHFACLPPEMLAF